MTVDRPFPRIPLLGFGLLLAAVYATALVLLGTEEFLRAPRLAAGAITFDLVVFVPALFYLLVVRTTRLPTISIVPVFLLSLLGASLVLPAEHEAPVRLLRWVAIPAELLLVGYVVTRAYRGIRASLGGRSAAGSDPLERLRAAAGEIVPVPALAGAVAHEIAVLHYAFLSWRATPHARPHDLAFSYHRKNGYTGLLVAGGMACVVEMVGVHLLVARWSQSSAWVLTAVSAYGLIWLLGHAQSVRLRPILLAPDEIVIRIGLLWSVRVPYARIERVTGGRGLPQRGEAGYLHAVAIGDARLLLELREPVEVDGPYGYRKREVTRIGVAVDEGERFAAEMERRVAAAS